MSRGDGGWIWGWAKSDKILGEGKISFFSFWVEGWGYFYYRGSVFFCFFVSSFFSYAVFIFRIVFFFKSEILDVY